MTKQQDALLGYLEFALTNMVEQNEILFRDKFGIKDVALNTIVGVMYDNAYEVLNEMERSCDEINDIVSPQKY